jgi:hypothetical protein
MALRLKGGGPLPEVGDRLVVGTCDIAGAGVRALLGLARADGTPPLAVHELELASLAAPRSRDDADAGAVFVPLGADGDAAPAVSLVRLDESLSLLAVNAATNEEDDAPLAAAVLALAAGRDRRVTIAGALRMDAYAENDAPVVVELGGEPSTVGSLDSKKKKAPKVRDGMLAALFHAARSMGVKTTCVFVPGHRVSRLGGRSEGGLSETEAEATQTTHALGDALAQRLNENDERFHVADKNAKGDENGAIGAYRYDAVAAATFRASRLWRENAGAPAHTDRMYT